jgi:hypothetical protein
MKAGSCHVLGHSGPIQAGKDAGDFVRVLSADLAAVIFREKPFQSLVPKTPYHV